MSAITASHLSKDYGDVRAVDDLSFTVESGTITAFLGPNGAGKTTTLRMILGLVTPTEGAAAIDGRAYTELEKPITKVGAVLEATAFHPALTARTHLRVLATAAGLGHARVGHVLDLVDLADAADRKVGHYSLGMRQRLALATALLGDPGVLILDEPANGLDPAGIHWLRGFLRAYAHEGGAVLVSTHVLTEIQQIADQVVIIARGALVRQATLTSGTNLEDLYLEATR
ncbi:ATP-binding cassette domain-containing protein [Streptosporangium soli]|nr:ATP-binding cassette domain-containing protein [Streptosporangium sp. KLBMP 9127]